MKYIEYHVCVPVSCDEYRIGQLYSVAKLSNLETKGDSGIEVLVNEPFEKDGLHGQYTHKVYHLGSRLPGWLTAIAPANALKLEEKAWNAFPYCKTQYTNPLLGDRFTYSVESHHFDNDTGGKENVFDLDKNILKQRVIKKIDIVDDPVQDCVEDPKNFKSEKTGRGPLAKGWEASSEKLMCAYKLITVEFRYFGLQNKVENWILSFQENVLAKFHRQLFCWIDEWFGMTIEDIRELEHKMAEEMRQKIEAMNPSSR